MINVIKNIYYIFRYVLPTCKKYGYTFLLHSRLGKTLGYVNFSDRHIYVPVTSEMFLATFFHEVGHVIYRTSDKYVRYSDMYSVNIDGSWPSIDHYMHGCVKEEAFASVFSKKALRNLGLYTVQQEQWLYEKLKTYTMPVYSHLESSYRIAGIDYQACKMLRYNAANDH